MEVTRGEVGRCDCCRSRIRSHPIWYAFLKEWKVSCEGKNTIECSKTEDYSKIAMSYVNWVCVQAGTCMCQW